MISKLFFALAFIHVTVHAVTYSLFGYNWVLDLNEEPGCTYPANAKPIYAPNKTFVTLTPYYNSCKKPNVRAELHRLALSGDSSPIENKKFDYSFNYQFQQHESGKSGIISQMFSSESGKPWTGPIMLIVLSGQNLLMKLGGTRVGGICTQYSINGGSPKPITRGGLKDQLFYSPAKIPLDIVGTTYRLNASYIASTRGNGYYSATIYSNGNLLVSAAFQNCTNVIKQNDRVYQKMGLYYGFGTIQITDYVARAF